MSILNTVLGFEPTISVTRLGDFFKLLVINLTNKVAQIFGSVLGYFRTHHFSLKPAVETFWATFEMIWDTQIYSNIWSHCPQSLE